MKRDWIRYLLDEWIIPLGLGAMIIGGAFGFVKLLMMISSR